MAEEKNQKMTLLITLITATVTLSAALITNWDKIFGKPKEKAADEIVNMDFCDGIKKLGGDVPGNFTNSIVGDDRSDNDSEECYLCKYTVDNVGPYIRRKADGTWKAEIDLLVDGGDVEATFQKYEQLLDACDLTKEPQDTTGGIVTDYYVLGHYRVQLDKYLKDEETDPAVTLSIYSKM